MKEIILNEEQKREFQNITGLKGNEIIISKENEGYYATIVNGTFIKVKIGNREKEDKFLEQLKIEGSNEL